MQCAHCATPVPQDARYCHNCGSLVSDAEGQAAVTGSMDESAVKHMERLLREDTRGEFEIERPIGRGGMAVVYLATEIHLSRKVAIKVLPPELTFGHGVQRFKREAKTSASLDHRCIIPIYRIASGGKLFWYAMKYLEGQSLEQILKEKSRFTLDETIHILSQVADALDYAHDHKVVHRDVKPANVMLDARERVVVTDFGIAKALTEGTLTASGSVVGTPYYMSPEQGMGKSVSGASDQYSVAVMAYRMLAGQVPFEGDSAIDILHKHCTVDPPPLDVLRPGLPDHVYRAVRTSLAKKPKNRLPTVTAFVEALKHPTADLVTADAPAVTPTEPRTTEQSIRTEEISQPGAQPKKRRRVWIAVSLLATGGVAGGAWWWTTRQSEEASGTVAQIEDTATAVATVAPDSGALPLLTLAEGQDSLTASPDSLPPAEAQAQAPPEEPPPTPVPITGRLTVAGLPRGGRVFVDGRRRSGTNFELPPGPHVIRMQATGYETVVDSVTLAAGDRVRLRFSGRTLPPPVERPVQPPAEATPRPQSQFGVVQIRINPWANVTVDGVSLGRKSRLVDTLRAGVAHSLRFQRAGFTTVDTTITVRPRERSRIAIRMIPRNQ